jgi:hypothetical protein
MAASVRIEDEAFSDTRIERLGVLLDTSRYDALGRLAYLWRQCTAMGKDVLAEELVEHHVKIEALVKSGMAEKTDDGVRMKGARGRIEWLASKREVGKKVGPKGARYGSLGGRPKEGAKGKARKDQPAAPAPAPIAAPVPAEPSVESPAKKPRAPRPRNEVFDAIVAVTLLDATTAGDLIGKVTAVLGKANPPYTAEEVHEFGRRFHEFCPWAKNPVPTPSFLQQNIGLVRTKALPTAPPAQAGSSLADEIKRNGDEFLKRMEELKAQRGEPETGGQHGESR